VVQLDEAVEELVDVPEEGMAEQRDEVPPFLEARIREASRDVAPVARVRQQEFPVRAVRAHGKPVHRRQVDAVVARVEVARAADFQPDHVARGRERVELAGQRDRRGVGARALVGLRHEAMPRRARVDREAPLAGAVMTDLGAHHDAGQVAREHQRALELRLGRGASAQQGPEIGGDPAAHRLLDAEDVDPGDDALLDDDMRAARRRLDEHERLGEEVAVLAIEVLERRGDRLRARDRVVLLDISRRVEERRLRVEDGHARDMDGADRRPRVDRWRGRDRERTRMRGWGRGEREEPGAGGG